MTFHYTDNFKQLCEGKIDVLSIEGTLEMIVNANGWSFHVIIGSHEGGNYLCIPNWDIGSEYADFSDIFWNEERLRNHTNLHPDNIRAIVKAVAVAAETIRRTEIRGCG